jgi:hypothetical protein
MATFTFRVAQELALGVSSARMQSWLDAFLRHPRVLPCDPGPGDERISLSLSPGTVAAVAAYARCSHSSALRRIATERLRGSNAPAASRPHGVSRSRTPVVPAYGAPPGGGVLAEWLIHVFIWVLFVGASLFFNSRKSKE